MEKTIRKECGWHLEIHPLNCFYCWYQCRCWFTLLSLGIQQCRYCVTWCKLIWIYYGKNKYIMGLNLVAIGLSSSWLFGKNLVSKDIQHKQDDWVCQLFWLPKWNYQRRETSKILLQVNPQQRKIKKYISLFPTINSSILIQ